MTMSNESFQLNIVVVGAGLGGLAAAISIAEAGHRVLVLEAARQLGEVGAGLQITPNASKILFHCGLQHQIEAVGSEPLNLSVHRYADGSTLFHDADFNTQMRSKYNAPFIDVHRGDLHSMLLEKARSLGVEVRTNSRVRSLDTVSRTISTENDDSVAYDLVIGGDGLWSKCRETLLGTHDAPLPTGDLAYRIVLHIDQIQDQELREMITTPACRFWIGPDAHVVAYSMKNSTMFNVVLLCPDDLPAEVSRQPGSVEEMKGRFQGWDPVLTRLLDQVESVDKWKLMHRAELEKWISDDGRLVLLGDACHPMLPYLAQGANSAIEDGAVLGRCLMGMSSSNQVSQRMQLYQKLRKTRSEAIARETFLQRAAFHMIDGEDQQRRDLILKEGVQPENVTQFPSRWSCPQAQAWLYGYDAIETADEAVGHLR